MCDLGHLFVNQSPHLEGEDPESIHFGLLECFKGILCVNVSSPPSTLPLAHSMPASMVARSRLRAFALAVPSAWNTLPPNLHMSTSLISFRTLFKCHPLSVTFLKKKKKKIPRTSPILLSFPNTYLPSDKLQIYLPNVCLLTAECVSVREGPQLLCSLHLPSTQNIVWHMLNSKCSTNMY